MRQVRWAAVGSLLACHAGPRLTARDLRAYCAIQAYEIGAGVPLDSIQRKAKGQGIQVTRRDSVLWCAR